MSTQIAAFPSKLLLAVSFAPDEIGARLKAARENCSWTQMEFAIEANVSLSSVQRWESGKLPPLRELRRIACILGVDECELVEPSSRARDEAAGDLLDGKLDEVLAEIRDLREEVRSLREERRAHEERGQASDSL